MKIVRERIKSYFSPRTGWTARKEFITNGSSSYAIMSKGFLNKADADKKAESMKWRKSHS